MYWSQEAAAGLRTLEDGLEAAAARVRAAVSADWVSPAATAYHEELEAQREALVRLVSTCDGVRFVVLEHTNTADTCTWAGGYCP